MQRIGVLTSGGDCPGMNAAIRSVVRTCISKNITPFGVHAGYKGLIDGDIQELTNLDVANMIQKGGTFLRSARSEVFRRDEGQQKAVQNIEKHKLDALIVIGGDGSLAGANMLYTKHGFPVIGLPGSIDNDIYGTDMSIGVDTALNTIVSSIDMINDTASSHDRTFLIEVMGRNSGYLAIAASITAGAEGVLIPEVPYNLDKMIEKIRKRYEQGKSRSIIIVAEGVGSAYDFGKAFELIGGFDTRITVLGHLQRGGSPTYFDRSLASRMGMEAVKAAIDGKAGIMMGLKDTQIVHVPLGEVLSNKKKLNPQLLELAETLNN